MSLSHLKRNSSSSFDKLNSQLAKLNNKNSGNNSDDRYWNLEVDKAGNGYAVIRFLPEIEGEDFPFVQIWDHYFQGPGGWYIEKSLTTIGQDDPLGQENAKLWATGNESDKELARKRKRRLKYHSNIYVISDPAHPENEGKVFLFAYGKKIFDKIKDLMNPSFPDDPAINPFDLWGGANFKLKRRIVEAYPNYDKSEFDSPGPLANDEKLEEIHGKQYSLKELVDPKHFKSYDDLKNRLARVLGEPTVDEETKEELREKSQDESVREKAAAEPKLPAIDEDEDSDLAFFKNLADS